MKEITRTVYLLVWLDSAHQVQAKLSIPREGRLPDLTGVAAAFRINLRVRIPEGANVQELPLPPVTLRAGGEISAEYERTLLGKGD